MDSTAGSPAPEAASAAAELRHGFRSWALPPGGSLTFGRSSRCDIAVATDPEDLLVSRHAGTLTGVHDGVLVTNASQRHPILLQPVPGREIEIGPGMTVGTMPHARSRVLVVGRHSARYLIYVDCTGLLAPPRPAAEGGPASRPAAGRATAAYGRMDLTTSQRRYLIALCEPVLSRVGTRTTPSYHEIAARCGVSHRTVRNSLDELRRMLTADYGLPGLQSEDGPGGHSLPGLSRWAVDSGNATLADLELLDP